MLRLNSFPHVSGKFQSIPPFIAFKRPEGEKQHIFPVYFGREVKRYGLEVLLHNCFSIVLPKIKHICKNLGTKRIFRIIHLHNDAPPDEMKCLWKKPIILTQDIEKKIDDITRRFEAYLQEECHCHPLKCPFRAHPVS